MYIVNIHLEHLVSVRDKILEHGDDLFPLFGAFRRLHLKLLRALRLAKQVGTEQRGQIVCVHFVTGQLERQYALVI